MARERRRPPPRGSPGVSARASPARRVLPRTGLFNAIFICYAMHEIYFRLQNRRPPLTPLVEIQCDLSIVISFHSPENSMNFYYKFFLSQAEASTNYLTQMR